MNLLKNLKKQIKNLYKLAKRVSNGKWDFFVVVLDFLYSKLRFGVTMDEYLNYQFYNFKNRYRKSFFIKKHRSKYINITTRDYTRSKFIFYKRIPDAYKRDIILAPHCGEKNFIEFLKKYKHIIIKPDTGTLGIGVFSVEYTDDASAKELFAGFSEKTPVICEEFLQQHKTLAEVCPYNLNTVRIVSVLKDNEVFIVAATLKIGSGRKGEVTDIYYAAQIDVETGIVSTFAVDKNNKYAYHPITKAQIIGVRIPHWQEAVALVKNIHKRVPKCLIYGWDMAITSDGVELIEANHLPNTRIMQIDCIPKGDMILPLMKKNVFNQPKKRKTPYVADFTDALQTEPERYAEFLATKSEK